MTHTRLTARQARTTRAMYRRLIELSRERRQFTEQCRAGYWPVAHIPELWAAHVARRLAQSYVA